MNGPSQNPAMEFNLTKWNLLFQSTEEKGMIEIEGLAFQSLRDVRPI